MKLKPLHLPARLGEQAVSIIRARPRAVLASVALAILAAIVIHLLVLYSLDVVGEAGADGGVIRTIAEVAKGGGRRRGMHQSARRGAKSAKCWLCRPASSGATRSGSSAITTLARMRSPPAVISTFRDPLVALV